MAHNGDPSSDTLPHAAQAFPPRVAYTYGDVQPVRSTYIAHDPFFFCDISDQLLDEELMRELEESLGASDEMDEQFETFLKEFQEELTARPVRGSQKNPSFLLGDDTTAGVFERFDMSADFRPAPPQDILRALEQISCSRFGTALVAHVKQAGIVIEACDHVFGAEFSDKQNMILINTRQPEGDFQAGLIMALREAWRARHGAAVHPLSLFPDHGILINRVQSADLCVCLLRTAWEMSLAGSETLWDHLETRVMGDLARHFAREAAADFRSLNDGHAHFTAFEAWFLSDRSRISDRALIQTMLAEYSGHAFTSEEMSQLVVLDLLRAVGELPYGKNYLSGEISALIGDPIFSEVRERSTSNFLWFIKFEKSFRDMEQSLQSDADQPSATFTVRGSAPRPTSGEIHATPDQTSHVIDFPQHARNSRPASKRRRGDADLQKTAGEVIPFDIINRPFNKTFT